MADLNPEDKTPEEDPQRTPPPEIPAPLAPKQPLLEEPLSLDDEETQELSGMPGMPDHSGMAAGMEDAALEDYPAPGSENAPSGLPPDFEPIETVRGDPPEVERQEPEAPEPETPEPSPYFPEGTYEGAQDAEEFYDYSDTTPLYEPFAQKPAEKRVLGMTAPQRFFVALMLLLVIFVLGAFFLMISGKLVLPFM